MPDSFDWTIVNGRAYLRCVPLAARARHLFSTRQLELPADYALRRRNIDAFAADLGVAPEGLLRVKQVHGAHVLVVEDGPREPAGMVQADAVVSARLGTACAVQVADCVPILMAGPSGPVAAVHAGWRGTAAGVAADAVRALVHLGVDPSTLVAGLGPSIRSCCYQVDARVRDVFARSESWDLAESAFEADGEGHWRLDGPGINRRLLERAGVPADQIHDSGLCTACDLSRFYSYRAEGAGTGRLIAGIAVS
jgi:polyphenol oxidase